MIYKRLILMTTKRLQKNNICTPCDYILYSTLYMRTYYTQL